MAGFKTATETTAESQLGAVAAKHCHLEGLLQQLYVHDLHLLSSVLFVDLSSHEFDLPSPCRLDTGVGEGSRKLLKDLGKSRL